MMEGLRKTRADKVLSQSRHARVVPGLEGRDDRHERSVRVTIYQSESPIKGTRRQDISAATNSRRDKN
jgi:hypothetical protein